MTVTWLESAVAAVLAKLNEMHRVNTDCTAVHVCGSVLVTNE